MARRSLAYLPLERDDRSGDVWRDDGTARRLIAIPRFGTPVVSAAALEGPQERVVLRPEELAQAVTIDDVVRVRDQRLAVVSIDLDAVAALVSGRNFDHIEISIDAGSAGPTSLNAGPFTGALSSSVLNYAPSGDASPVWRPGATHRTSGTVTNCSSVSDCEAAGADILYIVAGQFHGSALPLMLGLHHSTYLGLNVAIANMADVGIEDAAGLHTFVQDVYETQSAEHFGDGHLGFVLLIGDAYADDNATVMVPTYDGYGGQELASDHYYACVAGDDDLEDVMLGRLSVGNVSEFLNVVNKLLNHSPMPSGEDWWKRSMLVAGLFYTIKDDYVELFDEYEDIIPDDHGVDRIYRHDFADDYVCAQAVVNAFNDGYLFINFAGDGWISEWYRTFRTTNIAGLSNGDRLPIALSMACMTGWFDNTTEQDLTGSYDCLAEQLVNASGKGAIACLAAPRNSDGGMFRTLTKRIYQAAFDEGCVFLGETFAVAKLLHLQDGGDVDYTRHFNLFGDPALIYRSDSAPTTLPDLTVRPHEIVWDPETVAAGEDLNVTVPVFNQSSQSAPGITVTLTGSCGGDVYDYSVTTAPVPGWGFANASFSVPNMAVGEHAITVELDPEGEVGELDEGNNSVARVVYAYPHPQGFPVDLGTDLHSPSIALGPDGPLIILFDEEARLWAVSSDGSIAWQTATSLDPLDFGLEIAAACGDLDGDGNDEIVCTRRMGLMAFDHHGGGLWNINTDDIIGCPVLADADADADLDIIVATKAFWGSGAGIRAYDENGGTIWTYDMSGSAPAASQLAAGDVDFDGRTDIVFADESGMLSAISTATVPPTRLWPPVAVGATAGSPLVLGDVDGDGALEVVVGGSTINCVNADTGSEEWSFALDSPVVSLALADIDEDARPDIFVGTESGMLHMTHGESVQWSVMLTGTPTSSAVVADLHAAPGLDIAVSTNAGYLHLVGAGGSEIMNPIPIPGGCGTPALVDLTGDGLTEFVVNSSDGKVHAFEFAALRGGDERATRSGDREWAGLGQGPTHAGLYAQPIAGTITADLLLSGRAVVTGDVVVNAGVTVLLAPGTKLLFADDGTAEFDVFGSFTAAGTASRPITIGADDGQREASSWQGLTFRTASVATLEHCMISGADVAMAAQSATVTLTDCALDDNTFGARLTDCSLDAYHTSFSRCDSLGLYVRSGSGTIRGCTIDGSGSGLMIRESATHAVDASSFTGSTLGSGVDIGKFATATFDSCTISENALHGVGISNAMPVFNDCTITGNAQSGAHCRKTAFPRFSRCTISGNRVGIHSDTGSTPNLGDDMYPATGYNSITGNQMAAIANYNGTDNPVFARRNWWGAAPPTGRVFLGYVLWQPYLSAPGGAVVSSVDDESIPVSFDLAPNVPNPFNPVTTLSFAVPAPGGDVEIAVYDIAGRRTALLASGHRDAGRYTVVWDGSDDGGRRVASGVYFARMVASDYVTMRKMILLK